MFNNIGEKIKKVAFIFFILSATICVLVGFSYIIADISLSATTTYGETTSSTFILTGILYIIIGPLASWLSSIVLYGFGELVANSTILANTVSNEENLSTGNQQSQSPSITNSVTLRTNVQKVPVQTNTPLQKDINDYYSKSTEILLNISSDKIVKIENEHNDWVKSTKNSTLNDLFETLDEQDQWEEDFVILTALEISNRINGK